MDSKMKTSKFKNVTQKLSFFKDYSSLLTSVVIAVVALLVLMLALLMGSKHRNKMIETSVSMGNKARSLSKTIVPSGQWQIEEKYQQSHEQDANETALSARQSAQRELLSYKIFPEPNESSTLIFEEFGRRFRSASEELIALLNARDCPTEAELNRHFRESGNQGIRRSGRQRSADSGQKLSEVEATIMDALCREKAESARVYANPIDLAGYEFWKDYRYPGMDEAVRDCWYWQLALWIIEDVIDTIDAVNSEDRGHLTSVFTSPVKRLLGVSFTAGEIGPDKEAAYDKPRYVREIAEALTKPCTGRLCDDDIDVVHFNVAVVVSTKGGFPFIGELCNGKQHTFRGFSGEQQPQIYRHNQITILKSDIESIDAEDETHEMYRYGEDAVVKLDLICEYIFKKSGYDKIKPESVKESLGEQKEQTAKKPVKKTGKKQKGNKEEREISDFDTP
jgi:hypothetical protein